MVGVDRIGRKNCKYCKTIEGVDVSKFDLHGKQALVTGGSTGIGFALARELAIAGADIVVIALDDDDLATTSERLADIGRKIQTFPVDLLKHKELPDFYDKLVKEVGGIDILVNNAGTTKRGPAHELSLEDWNLVISLNLTSVFVMSQVFARERIASGKKGKIINIASLLAEAVRPDNAPYASSKGGIRQLTKSLAVDWAQYGIHVNGIGPGYIQTSFNKSLWQDPQFSDWVEGRTPLGRWGKPEDLASTAVFLASEASDFITGQIIYVDGGWLITF